MATTKLAHSSALLRFISSFDVDPDNSVIGTALDEATFVSRFYTPKMKVSALAVKVLDELANNKILAENRTPHEGSFMYKLQNSDLRTTKPYLFQLSKTIMLECFSVVYAVEQKPELLKYLNQTDLQVARTNLKYLLDAIGDDPKYSSMTEDINKIDISMGYIQAQVPVLRGEV